jgi:hypothetical protein
MDLDPDIALLDEIDKDLADEDEIGNTLQQLDEDAEPGLRVPRPPAPPNAMPPGRPLPATWPDAQRLNQSTCLPDFPAVMDEAMQLRVIRTKLEIDRALLLCRLADLDDPVATGTRGLTPPVVQAISAKLRSDIEKNEHQLQSLAAGVVSLPRRRLTPWQAHVISWDCAPYLEGRSGRARELSRIAQFLNTALSTYDSRASASYRDLNTALHNILRSIGFHIANLRTTLANDDFLQFPDEYLHTLAFHYYSWRTFGLATCESVLEKLVAQCNVLWLHACLIRTKLEPFPQVTTPEFLSALGNYERDMPRQTEQQQRTARQHYGHGGVAPDLDMDGRDSSPPPPPPKSRRRSVRTTNQRQRREESFADHRDWVVQELLAMQGGMVDLDRSCAHCASFSQKAAVAAHIYCDECSQPLCTACDHEVHKFAPLHIRSSMVTGVRLTTLETLEMQDEEVR